MEPISSIRPPGRVKVPLAVSVHEQRGSERGRPIRFIIRLPLHTSVQEDPLYEGGLAARASRLAPYIPVTATSPVAGENVDPAGTYSGAGASAPTPADPARIFRSPGDLRSGGDCRPGRHVQRARARARPRRRQARIFRSPARPPKRWRSSTRPARTASRARARPRRLTPARIFRSPGRPPRRRRLSTLPALTAARAQARRRPIRRARIVPRAPAPRPRTRPARSVRRAPARPCWRRPARIFLARARPLLRRSWWTLPALTAPRARARRRRSGRHVQLRGRKRPYPGPGRDVQPSGRQRAHAGGGRHVYRSWRRRDRHSRHYSGGALVDPVGSYSLAGASAPTLAQPGYYVPAAGASSKTPDDPGYYTPYAGATAELLAQAPVISGTVAGQSAASGRLTRRLVPSRLPIQTSTLQTVFDPADGRRRRPGRRRRFQRAHGERAWRLPAVGDCGCDHERARRTCLHSERGLRDDDIHFDRHDQPRHERERRKHDRNSFVRRDARRLGGRRSWPISLTLDQTPGGFDIFDTAANITANLDQLNDPNIDATTISDNGQVGPSVQQLTTDATAIGKLQNMNSSPVLLAINDMAAAVQAGLSTLVAESTRSPRSPRPAGRSPSRRQRSWSISRRSTRSSAGSPFPTRPLTLFRTSAH